MEEVISYKQQPRKAGITIIMSNTIDFKNEKKMVVEIKRAFYNKSVKPSECYNNYKHICP